MADTIPARPPFAAQSIIWEKRGPLPVWAWLIIGLAGLFAALWWRRNKAAAAEANTGYTGTAAINQQQTIPPIINTWPSVPPGGGRNNPPTTNPGSPFPPAPAKVTVQGGTSSDAWINTMTGSYGLYWNQLAAMYPGIVENVQGSGPSARFKATKTYERAG
jgi:hypothetical protein